MTAAIREPMREVIAQVAAELAAAATGRVSTSASLTNVSLGGSRSSGSGMTTA